jgi:hypothetical protein
LSKDVGQKFFLVYKRSTPRAALISPGMWTDGGDFIGRDQHILPVLSRQNLLPMGLGYLFGD